MDVNHDISHIKLTSAEIGELFNSYIFNSASKQMLSYFVNIVDDPDCKSVVQFAFELANKVIQQIDGIFKSVNHPVPRGFSENDVNINADRLYSDHFILTFTRFMARFGFLITVKPAVPVPVQM